MGIIEISALSNGAHRNQTGTLKTVPDGWAVVPEDMELENFPFGEVTAEKINGVMTVVKWYAGTIPEMGEAEEPISEFEQLRADVDYIAAMTGVELL